MTEGVPIPETKTQPPLTDANGHVVLNSCTVPIPHSFNLPIIHFRIAKSPATYPCCTGCNCKITWVLVSSGFSPSFPSVGTTTTSPTGTLTSALAIFHMKSASLDCCEKQEA